MNPLELNLKPEDALGVFFHPPTYLLYLSFR